MKAMDSAAEWHRQNQALRTQLAERNRQLYAALNALAGMWNQCCPPPFTHQAMNAGEDAEEVLRTWQLLRADETAIELCGLDPAPEQEIPLSVKALLPAAQEKGY